jgi:hypothetical protein
MSLSFTEKCLALLEVRHEADEEKRRSVNRAVRFHFLKEKEKAAQHLEKAATLVWGTNRPQGW